MIRSAAKNHERVAVVVDPADYAARARRARRRRRDLGRHALPAGAQGVRAHRRLRRRHRGAPGPLRARSDASARRLSRDAARAAARWRASCATARTRTRGRRSTRSTARPPARRWPRAQVLQGKELSYNNLLDLDAALRICAEFAEPAAVDRQAQQPVRRGHRRTRAWPTPTGARARPIRCRRSAASSRSTARSTASWPARSRRRSSSASSRRPSSRTRARARGEEEPAPASVGDIAPERRGRRVELRSVAGGLLVQTAIATPPPPPPPRSSPSARRRADELRDLDFAWRVGKHVKSNAIVFAAGGRTLGVGAGQMSRVDSVRIAVRKARRAAGGRRWSPPTRSSRSATASTRRPRRAPPPSSSPAARCATPRSIAAADEHGLAMVFTGERHFRH